MKFRRKAAGAPSVAIVLGVTAPASAAPVPARAPTPGAGQVGAGDANRFPTWTGPNVGLYPSAVVAADLDGDGRPDLAWAHHDYPANTMSVQRNLGGGALGPITTYPASDRSTDIAAGDLNSDGRADLIVVSQGQWETNRTIDIYLNQGHATFAHSTLTAGFGATRLAIADLDGDGHPDLAIANNANADVGTTVGVLLGIGDGTFGKETRYTVGAGAFGIAAADIDGDGPIDLVAAHASKAEKRLSLDRAESWRSKPTSSTRGRQSIRATCSCSS